MILQKIWTERVYDGKFIAIDEMQLEWWKSWELVARKWNQQVVAGLLEHKENKSYVVIEQYRYPVQQKVIELVAGLQDKADLSPEEHFIEEIKEETWYGNIWKISLLAHTTGSAGLTSETALLYNAEVYGKRWEQSLEESEDIRVLEIPTKEFLHFLQTRAWEWQLIDPKVCMALYMTQMQAKNIL